MEALIIHSHTLFDDQINPALYASSPPLPPAPLGEPLPPFAYGSTYTKFSEYGSQPQINSPLPQTPTRQTSTGDDFAPQLPPRPPASIHPSSRGNSGNANGLSNSSPTRSEAETNFASPTTLTQALPLPLRPGRQGALTPIQSLRGTKGLDFSQHETAEGDWTGPAPTSPPLSDPPTPPPPASKSQQIPPPPPPSALSQSTFALQQQQQQPALSQRQPALTQTMTQEQPHPKGTALSQPPPPLPAIEGTAFGDFEPIASLLETSSSSIVHDGHSTDHANPITPDAPTGPTLQPLAFRPLIQREPHVVPRLQAQPIQVAQAQEQSQPSPAHPDEPPHGGPESQDLPPSRLH